MPVENVDKPLKYPMIDVKYRHYKGGTYVVKFLSRHTTTDEILVNYQSIEFGSYHSRPLQEWFEEIKYSTNSALERLQKTRFALTM